MAGRSQPPFGYLEAALLICKRAARVEAAAGGRVDRAGHVACQDDAVAGPVSSWDRGSAPPTAAPGYKGAAGSHTARSGRPVPHHPQVHDRHPVADVADHAQIVGDEQVSQTETDPASLPAG